MREKTRPSHCKKTPLPEITAGLRPLACGANNGSVSAPRRLKNMMSVRRAGVGWDGVWWWWWGGQCWGSCCQRRCAIITTSRVAARRRHLAGCQNQRGPSSRRGRQNKASVTNIGSRNISPGPPAAVHSTNMDAGKIFPLVKHMNVFTGPLREGNLASPFLLFLQNFQGAADRNCFSVPHPSDLF